MSFDIGFSHLYPATRGLVERLEGESRLIEVGEIRHVTSQDVFPEIIVNDRRCVELPLDARDLRSYVRIARQERHIVMSGLLLGIRLKRIQQDLGGVPSDTVLDRFSVHTSLSVGMKKFGGIDIKLLPPYDRLGASLSSSLEIIQNDFKGDDLSKVTPHMKDSFIRAVSSGFVHVS